VMPRARQGLLQPVPEQITVGQAGQEIVIRQIVEFALLFDVFEPERDVSRQFQQISTAALAENDHTSYQFAQWFVAEQVEEEALIKRVLQNLRLIEGAAGGLFMIDQNLATRVYKGPAGAATTPTP